MESSLNENDEKKSSNATALFNKIGVVVLVLTLVCIAGVSVVLFSWDPSQSSQTTLKNAFYSIVALFVVHVIQWLWIGTAFNVIKPANFKQLRTGKWCVFIAMACLLLLGFLSGLYVKMQLTNLPQ